MSRLSRKKSGAQVGDVLFWKRKEERSEKEEEKSLSLLPSYAFSYQQLAFSFPYPLLQKTEIALIWANKRPLFSENLGDTGFF